MEGGGGVIGKVADGKVVVCLNEWMLRGGGCWSG